MSSKIRFQTISEALKNAPITEVTNKANDPVVITGPITIDSGDAIMINGKPCVELDAFTLFLSLGMTAECDLFAGLRCTTPQNVIYISGRANREKFLKKISIIDERYDKSRFRLITNDQLHEDNQLRLEENVSQQNILQGLKSMNGQAGVIVFDNAESLILSDSKNIDRQSIRDFVQKMMELKVIQVWMCPDTKSANPVPEDLFDFEFRVEPDKKPDILSFSVTCEKNGYFDQEKLPTIYLELSRYEIGRMALSERGLINDRLVAISLAIRGKTQMEIGEILGKDQSTISLWLRKAKDEGLINRVGNSYSPTEKGRKTLSY